MTISEKCEVRLQLGAYILRRFATLAMEVAHGLLGHPRIYD